MVYVLSRDNREKLYIPKFVNAVAGAQETGTVGANHCAFARPCFDCASVNIAAKVLAKVCAFQASAPKRNCHLA